jgi:hypothetical protein
MVAIQTFDDYYAGNNVRKVIDFFIGFLVPVSPIVYCLYFGINFIIWGIILGAIIAIVIFKIARRNRNYIIVGMTSSLIPILVFPGACFVGVLGGGSVVGLLTIWASISIVLIILFLNRKRRTE